MHPSTFFTAVLALAASTIAAPVVEDGYAVEVRDPASNSNNNGGNGSGKNGNNNNSRNQCAVSISLFQGQRDFANIQVTGSDRKIAYSKTEIEAEAGRLSVEVDIGKAELDIDIDFQGRQDIVS